jgi:hypothetical protein
MDAAMLAAAAPQGAAVPPGPNAVAPIGLNHGSPSIVNMPLNQGGPANGGLQQGPQSDFNPQVAPGGQPEQQLPVQQVQQQLARDRRGLCTCLRTVTVLPLPRYRIFQLVVRSQLALVARCRDLL